jgi:fibronectin-binding autotransporter adhesin
MKKIIVIMIMSGTMCANAQTHEVYGIKGKAGRLSAMALRPLKPAGLQNTAAGTQTVNRNPETLTDPAFQAVRNNKYIELTWIAAKQEPGADVFTVMRTTDKIHFETVSMVKGQGKAAPGMPYKETDYRPLKGLSLYRLETTFYNGQKHYSELIPVNFSRKVNKPVRKGGKGKLKLQELDQQEMLLVLKDKEGKEQYSKFIILVDDKTLIAVDIEKKVNPGNYLVIATSNDKIYGKKVTVK